MKEAAFSLSGYNFPQMSIDMSSLVGDKSLGLAIKPSGVFNTSEKTYTLKFEFKAFVEEVECIRVLCVANFTFKGVNVVDDIPDFFYANSIAILFPYVRAFVSTLTLQANYKPIVLPTMNLSDLSQELKQNTNVRE